MAKAKKTGPSNKPNQGGGSNRQGPAITKGRSAITDSWSMKDGTRSKAGTNAAGHNWTRPRPASHRSGDGGWYLGRSRKAR